MHNNRQPYINNTKNNIRNYSQYYPEQAVKILNENGINIKNLGELSLEKFNKIKHFLKDKEILKRATHAVTENLRTIEAYKELQNNNIKKFGELMNQSHISLRDDYEVTGKELDSLVEAACDKYA